MKKVKGCLHPIEKAFKEPREDGSGKWDLICAECGEVMCEVANPLEAEAKNEIVEEIPAEVDESLEAAEVEIESIADAQASTTVEEGKGEITSPFTSDDNQPTSYVSREPDKIGGRFQELLPVPVDDHELAQFGIELAEQASLWRRTKLDAKKFAKAAKDVTDKCEERMIEIEEIFQDHARMTSIDVQWEYDFASGIKKLRRCDTWEIVKEEILSVEERQPSFDFASSEKAVEKLAEVQAGNLTDGSGTRAEEVQTSLADDPAEGCLKCEGAGYYMNDDPDAATGGEIFCDCEAGKLLEKQSDPDAGLPVIDVDDFEAPVLDVDSKGDLTIDKNRTCCMPSDRDHLKRGDVLVLYCRVCHLIIKMSPISGGDPWDTVDFTPGEKVTPEEIEAAKAKA